jgi:hypothetical protein
MEILSFTTTWTELGITLNEISHAQKEAPYDLTHLCDIKHLSSEIESTMLVTSGLRV